MSIEDQELSINELINSSNAICLDQLLSERSFYRKKTIIQEPWR